MTGAVRSFVVRSRSLLSAAAIVFLLATSGILHGGGTSWPGASRVAYAAACWDVGCNGFDPQATGCSSTGVTVDGRDGEYPQYAYWVQLRYSTGCGANWGRTQATSYNICFGTGNPFCSGVHFQASGVGWSAEYDGTWQDLDVHWTLMLSGASSVDRVCTWYWAACTPWY